MLRALRRTVRRAVLGTPCCNGNTEQLRRVLHHDGVLRYTARTGRKRHRCYASLPDEPELAVARVILLATPLAVSRWLAEVPAPPVAS